MYNHVGIAFTTFNGCMQQKYFTEIAFTLLTSTCKVYALFWGINQINHDKLKKNRNVTFFNV